MLGPLHMTGLARLPAREISPHSTHVFIRGGLARLPRSWIVQPGSQWPSWKIFPDEQASSRDEKFSSTCTLPLDPPLISIILFYFFGRLWSVMIIFWNRNKWRNKTFHNWRLVHIRMQTHWFFRPFLKVLKKAEFWHVNFLLHEKHCSKVFFHWFALRFWEIKYVKKSEFCCSFLFMKTKPKNPIAPTNNNQQKLAYANYIKSNLACSEFILLKTALNKN